MNKEEAIEKLKLLKDFKQTYYGYQWFKVEVCADKENIKAIDTVLDYIADLEKENAVKESHIKIVSAYNEELEKYKRKHSLIKNHYISKDKIRDKIEELEEMKLDNDDVFGQMKKYAVLVLKEILGEDEK